MYHFPGGVISVTEVEMTKDADSGLGVGIMACGNIAGTMAESISKMEGIRVAACASRTLEKAELFAEKHSVPKAYGTYEEMLEDRDVGIVYVASPHSHHAEHTEMCIRAGKPVICEKSFTVNASQAEKVLALAHERGVFVTEAILTRYVPLIGTIRDLVRHGSIGRITAVHCDLGYSVAHRQRVIDPGLAGGALLDVGVYCVNFILSVTGGSPSSVSASARLSDGGVDLENAVTMVLDTPDGEVLSSFCSSVTGRMDRCGFIYGTDGFIKVGNVNNYEYAEVYGGNGRLEKRIARPEQTGTAYFYQFDSCRRVLSEGGTECPEMPHSETLRVMRIMDRIRREMGVSYPFERTGDVL